MLSLPVRAARRIAYGFQRIQANFTGGQFLCYFAFSRVLSPLPGHRDAPFVKTPQIPVQKCGILQDFVLYWIKNQHSRAAPGAVCQKTSTLPYRECRGEHCSPANLAQQRSFGKASHKANGHGRAMLAPTRVFRQPEKIQPPGSSWTSL